MNRGKLLNNAIDLVNTGRNLKALVIGEAILDAYTYGGIERTSTGVAVPTIDVDSTDYCLGGAANIAANLSCYVDGVSLVSPVGMSDESRKVLELCEKHKVDSSLMIERQDWDIVKERVYVSNQQLFRLDKCTGSQESFNEEIFGIADKIEEFDIVVIADYNFGFLSDENIRNIIETCIRNDIPSIATTRNSNLKAYKNLGHLVVNSHELDSISKDLGSGTNQSIHQRMERVFNELNLKSILVTCGEQGLISYDGSVPHRSSVKSVYPVNVSGAGDTVLALYASLVKEREYNDLTGIVLNIAGQLVVSNEKTAVVTKDLLVDACYGYYCSMSNGSKSVSRANMADLVNSWRRAGDRIVFTNGCFDILHTGHIKLLHEAKKLGDRLIVGINSDSSVRRLKGKDRPINNENDRIMVLASLEVVDCIVLFEEVTAIELVKAAEPDVYVKGAEYVNRELPEAKYASCVEYVDMHGQISTTKIIDRLEGK